jgi:GSCFA family/Polysaccharide biosynthesis enzyme WcbI
MSSEKKLFVGFSSFINRFRKSPTGASTKPDLSDELNKSGERSGAKPLNGIVDSGVRTVKTIGPKKSNGKPSVWELLEQQKAAQWGSFSRLKHASTANKKILLLGNCQTRGLARLMRAMIGDAEATAIELLPEAVKRIQSRDPELVKLISESDLIFVHHDGLTPKILEETYASDFSKVRLIPKIGFAAFHPDMDYLEDAEGHHVLGPLGAYHSSLAFFCWKNKVTPTDTLKLFCEKTYQTLGYFDYWAPAKKMLLEEEVFTHISLELMVKKWEQKGCWMYSLNHPKLFVLVDIAKALLKREGIEILPGVEEYVDDEMNTENVWPVYPEIAKRLGLEGHYLFKRATPSALRDMPVPMMTLEQFIDESFKAYSKYSRDELICHRLSSNRYEKILELLEDNATPLAFENPSVTVSSEQPAAASSPRISPYAGLPDFQFWRRGVERLAVADVNPVTNARFKLGRESKVATAGSCFAQHIARTLTAQGFNYFVTEMGEGLPRQDAERRNFGVFSARFGNLYTARQLVQLFERAYDRFHPLDSVWSRDDGKFVDPFRPQIEPDGFESPQALETSRTTHFAAVRNMFENLDVFVFTLGLTEAWRNRVDGAVFPLAPGVVAGEMDHEQYEFVNFGVKEVVNDLQQFINQLSSINPGAQIIFTVSPVPLIATYENQHVLVSTTYSKSVLRAAAGEISKTNTRCDYFPSYEIITGNYNRGQYFENDLRSIKQEGVDHVMRLFLLSYSNENSDVTTIPLSSSQQEIMNEIVVANRVVCDEEAIDKIE